MGGKARAAKLSDEERRSIASQAAETRWRRHRQEIESDISRIIETKLVPVVVYAGELRVNSRLIADGLSLPYRGLLRAVATHRKGMDTLGEIKMLKIAGEKIYYLNFDHVAFLLVLGNHPLESREKLVDCFNEARASFSRGASETPP